MNMDELEKSTLLTIWANVSIVVASYPRSEAESKIQTKFSFQVLFRENSRLRDLNRTNQMLTLTRTF